VRCPVCRHDIRTNHETIERTTLIEENDELAQSALTNFLVQTLMQPHLDSNRSSPSSADADADILLFEAIIRPSIT
jgi:hypothetical protein